MPHSLDAPVDAHDLPRRLVLESPPRAEVPAQRASGAHLDKRREIIFTDADRVRRAGRYANAALDATVGVDDGLLQVPEPYLAGSFVDVVHHLPDVEAGH